jgi:hypothetical protein
VMSESEWFLRTFVPAPVYDVWIRVGFVPIYSVGIKVVLWTPVPICSVWIGDILEQLYLFILSDSEKLITGIYVTKHISDSDTRNRDMCHQIQLWFSHYWLETWIYVTKHNSDLATRNEWVVLLDTCPWLWCLNQSGFWGHLSLPLAIMSESELVLSPSTVSESKLFCEHLSLFGGRCLEAQLTLI